MDEHPHATIVKRACIALRKADLATISEIFSEKAELIVPGKNPLAGTYTGRDRIAEYASSRLERSDGTFKSVIHDVVANERHSFIIERFMAKRLDRSLDVRAVTVLHVFDGAVEGGIQLSANPYMEDEFWT